MQLETNTGMMMFLITHSDGTLSPEWSFSDEGAMIVAKGYFTKLLPSFREDMAVAPAVLAFNPSSLDEGVRQTIVKQYESEGTLFFTPEVRDFKEVNGVAMRAVLRARDNR